MKFPGSLSFLTILSESMNLLPKNGKLILLIATSSVFLSICISFLFSYSLQSVVSDMNLTFQQAFLPDPSTFSMPDPNSDPFTSADPTTFTPSIGFNVTQVFGLIEHLMGDFSILLAVQFISYLAFSCIFFFSTISTILVSAMSHRAKNMSLRELFSIIWKTWTSPLITIFYMTCLVTGYSASVIALAAPLLISHIVAMFWVVILVFIPAFILCIYLSVPWTLSVVVSVMEENCYGLEALGKAAALVKGKRWQGFLLNLIFNLVVVIIFKGYQMMLKKTGLLTISLMLLASVVVLVKMLAMVAYTVFYFQCKELHGEEIELHGSVEYTKLPVLGNDLP